jgi:hypothetical protein
MVYLTFSFGCAIWAIIGNHSWQDLCENDIESLWSPTLCDTNLKEDGLFLTIVIIYMVVTLLVWYLVFDVAKVCYGNFFEGKTTIERFGRSGGWGADLDEVWERIVNSGIKGDKRIY